MVKVGLRLMSRPTALDISLRSQHRNIKNLYNASYATQLKSQCCIALKRHSSHNADTPWIFKYCLQLNAAWSIITDVVHWKTIALLKCKKQHRTINFSLPHRRGHHWSIVWLYYMPYWMTTLDDSLWDNKPQAPVIIAVKTIDSTPDCSYSASSCRPRKLLTFFPV
jgi:hypothetical protein